MNQKPAYLTALSSHDNWEGIDGTLGSPCVQVITTQFMLNCPRRTAWLKAASPEAHQRAREVLAAKLGVEAIEFTEHQNGRFYVQALEF